LNDKLVRRTQSVQVTHDCLQFSRLQQRY